MTEAAITIPVAILMAMLLIRLFVFYLDILTTGIEEHRQALMAQDSYEGIAIRTYETDETVEMLAGGILKKAVSKTIEVRTYLINEDFLVRSGEILD